MFTPNILYFTSKKKLKMDEDYFFRTGIILKDNLFLQEKSIINFLKEIKNDKRKDYVINSLILNEIHSNNNKKNKEIILNEEIISCYCNNFKELFQYKNKINKIKVKKINNNIE
jgi:hypothetical protein